MRIRLTFVFFFDSNELHKSVFLLLFCYGLTKLKKKLWKETEQNLVDGVETEKTSQVYVCVFLNPKGAHLFCFFSHVFIETRK